MRRAGWQVRVLAEESGSFEENPPTLSDFIKRDLRWCQGNWQYLHLLGRPGLHRIGRLQLGLAILMYVSGPAWIAVLAGRASAARSLAALGVPTARAGSPLLGVPAAVGGLGAAGGDDGPRVRPQARRGRPGAARAELRRAYGGGVRGVGLGPGRAPVLVRPGADHGRRAGRVRAPACSPAGRSAGRRNCATRAPSWAEALRGLWPQTLFGPVLGGAVWRWRRSRRGFGRVCSAARCVLAVPFAVVTSWIGWGRCWRGWASAPCPRRSSRRAVVVASGPCRRRRPAPAPAARPGAVEAPAVARLLSRPQTPGAT